jgi:tetratricopeptide (TPR) repeat protein
MGYEENWEMYANFAQEAYNAGNLEVSANILVLAIEEAENFGEEDGRYLGTLERLGDVFCAAEHFEDAEDQYLLTLKLKIGSMGDKTLSVAGTQHKLANLYFQQGQYAKAEALLTTVVRTCKQHLPGEHRYLQTVERNLQNVKDQKVATGQHKPVGAAKVPGAPATSAAKNAPLQGLNSLNDDSTWRKVE